MHSSFKNSFAAYMGHWLIKPDILQQAVTAFKAGIIPDSILKAFDEDHQGMGGVEMKAEDSKPYAIAGDGIAMFSLRGAMSKAGGCFSVGTVEIRKAIRQARRDPQVKAAFMVAETPGGHVSGTKEFADEIKAFVDSGKLFYVQVEDLLASAGVWATAHATAIYANEMASIGSIGVVAQVVDSSQMFEREGIKVHTISTGKHKGAFAQGSEITDEQLELLQAEVDEINVFFKAAIVDGRGIDPKALDEIATGQTFIASKALKHGLIDGIQTADETLQMIQDSLATGASRSRAQDLNKRFAAITADQESAE